MLNGNISMMVGDSAKGVRIGKGNALWVMGISR